MIKSLTLKNFRKVEDEITYFTPGLNIIRGANESSKTTRIEAVGYAMFGARALREPFAEVVTYDKPENSLKVDLIFEFDEVEYRIVRGKSGAECIYSDQRVTGQTEVTKFVERLFGCSADVMSSLQMASQNKVRGVLESDGAASSLVEKLAQLGVIENLIDTIQNQLPSGNTKAVQSSIDFIENNPVPEPVPGDSVPVEISKKALQDAILSVKVIEDKSRALNITKAVETISAARSIVDMNRVVQRNIERLTTESQQHPVPPEVSEETLALWKQEAATEEMQAIRRKHYAMVKPVLESIDRTVFDEAYASLETAIKQRQTKIRELTEQRKSALLTKINEKECAFCKKDLSEVPEVTQWNDIRDDQIEKANADILTQEDGLKGEQQTLAECNERIQVDRRVQKDFVDGFWTLDMSVIPAQPSWVGAVPSEPGEVRPIKVVEGQWKVFHTALDRQKQATSELAKLVLQEEIDTTEAERIQTEYTELSMNLKAAHNAESQARVAVSQAEGVYNTAHAKYESDLARIESNRLQVVQLKTTLEDMTKHNELIKRLREARPQIATQLWGNVLGAISHYFTQIRGMAGIVTRDADGFKVNGRSVAGLSGSTLDALGLAIRIALSKVFLPNVPFLFLDEPFSGADDNRETNGLGVIASAGFAQTLLVTHSSLADSLADNLIAL